ncbi:hypothetical protein ABIA33_007683 [Streptacidiphilus sp. MAP12-16]|uniref:hypothetical protein n=1 Tax=Streptacidiphilus sp. MAP12-16 TaxID=3156300 RepID=UPI003518C355
MNPEELRGGLPGAADLAGPLEIDLGRVAGRSRHRRRVRYAAVGCTSLAVAAAALVGISHLGGQPTRVVQPAAGPVATPSASASSGVGASSGQTRRYTCGGTIAAPIDPGTHHDTVTVSISGVRRAANGAPLVTYTVASTSTLHVVKNAGRPRVVVLKDGKIVAGQDLSADASHPPVSGKPADFITIDPAHPYSATLAAPIGAPCGGAAWTDLWAPGAGYQVAVVVSDWELSTPARTPIYTPGYVNPDPVIVVSAPIAG